MLRSALRNLFQSKIRLALAVGGVALALMLILALDAVVGGMEAKLTSYIDYSGADIFVAQSGVRNMHGHLSAAAIGKVRCAVGRPTVTPVLYLTNVVVANESATRPCDRAAASSRRGRVSPEGRALPFPQRVIDRGLPSNRGRIGDTVEICREFTLPACRKARPI
jgi:hypothetical protein